MNDKDAKGVYRWWFLTYNNPDADWRKTLDTFEATYCIGQLEKGKEGTVHIQALLYYVTSVRASRFKGIPCWIKGIPSADAKLRVNRYVSKEESRMDGPYQYGVQPANMAKGRDFEAALQHAKAGRFDQIQASIYIPYLANLKKINLDCQVSSTRENVCGIWIWGAPGYGKSHYAQEEYGSDAYFKSQNKWFDGYVSQRNVILDDLDASGACLSHYLKRWMDKWACLGETKGGTIMLQYKRFIVTSNYLPEDLWPSDQTLVEAIKRRCLFIFFTRKQYCIIAQAIGQYPNKLDDL